MMTIPIYEIFYENRNGDVVYCQDLESETDALEEIHCLNNEYPENHYWYEVVYKEKASEYD